MAANNDNDPDKYNPSAEAARRLYDHENEGAKDTDDATGDQNTSAEDAAKDTRDKEAKAGGDWVDKVTGKSRKRKATISGNSPKKKGPMALVFGLLLGGGAMSTILFSPAVAIVQFKQIMLGDLNDQVRAMEIFDDHLIKSKLKSVQATFGVCTNKVSILCRFSTMSKREVQNFRNAGITIEPEGKGRIKPTKMIMPDGTEIKTPQDLDNYRKNSPEGPSVLRRAFNPKFAGLYDQVANGVFARNNTDRTRKITGDTKEKQDEAFKNATAGESAGIDANGYSTDDQDRKYVTNENGTRVYAEQPSSGSLPAGSVVDAGQFDSLVEVNLEGLEKIADQAEAAANGVSATKTILNSTFKAASAVGIADTYCTIYNKGRAASASMKISGKKQEIQTAVVVNNVSDRIMAGTATPEEVTYMGDKLMAIDTRPEVVDESSFWVQDGEEMNAAPHANPYYGANAFDSAGYHTAAYNDPPTLTSRDMQHRVGGGLGGTFESILSTMSALFGGRENIGTTCGIVQSWWARGVGLVAGVVSAVGSFGLSTVVSLGGSVALGFAGSFLDAMLADVIAQKVVTEATDGVDLGNAAYAGNGALYGELAASHGMAPASSEELEGYLAATEYMNQERIAAEIYDAKATPFDIYNQYSFLGALVHKINPAIIKSTASVSSAVTSVPSFLSTAFSAVTPTVQAVEGFNPERFKKCSDDEGYRILGIDADTACFPRFYMPPEQLSIEPTASATWMIENGHIEEEGAAKSDEFKKWIEFCTERDGGWGEAIDEDASDDAIGLNCVRKDKDQSFITRLNYFGAYHMALQLQDVKDNGLPTAVEGAASTLGTVVSPLAADHTTVAGYGPRSAPPGSTGSTETWEASLSIAHSSTAVFSIADGQVISVGDIVVIQHSDGLKSRYSHMDGVRIEVGDEVTVGQEIGVIGCTGRDPNCQEYLGFALWIDEVHDPDRYSQYTRAPQQAGDGAGRAINPANFLTDNGISGFEDQVNGQ